MTDRQGGQYPQGSPYQPAPQMVMPSANPNERFFIQLYGPGRPLA